MTEPICHKDGIPIFSFAGFSNSGKTTLMCKIVSALKDKGYRVATVKHDGHDFSMDQQGKDTWKHREAGADVVAITSASKVAIIDYRAYEREKQLLQVLSYIENVDIILVEGFKNVPMPKIFVVREQQQLEQMDKIPMIEGVATDFLLEQQRLPVYDINNVQAMAEYIIKRCNLA
ncbi:molybdopterin-guanine dinucleotide biosynthesis protein B [Desulfuribacillus alkaliarsenatis]|uniref:Molybdopterin-guanine dinucleotide biosynthesis protein B n=1 Tax=Desulfuribacillus alkaliarsenatis TaxID=766136 RepID=A0A1E5G1W9_9FIRM|nr:molybdopterin-guanine dinucleotide biosynthesis protein B [Desulfuribacillus alkaliarsenatis]OEF96975.1 molybdopterin-guanine dinucleotide biosynthesis protein B [Desulfuribacillus alkaliarsenatis]